MATELPGAMPCLLRWAALLGFLVAALEQTENGQANRHRLLANGKTARELRDSRVRHRGTTLVFDSSPNTLFRHQQRRSELVCFDLHAIDPGR